jgi:hypothetical protein
MLIMLRNNILKISSKNIIWLKFSIGDKKIL